MEKAGRLLIIVGILLIVVKTVVDYWIALSPKEIPPPTQGAFSAAKVGLPDLNDVAELLKAPHGAGIALVTTGAVLLVATSGIDVSFGASVETPTPSSTAS